MKLRMVFILTLICLTSSLVSACGDETPQPTPIVGTPQPTVALGPEAYAGTVTYRSLHPSSGVLREMTISADGKVMVVDSQSAGSAAIEGQLSAEELTGMRALFVKTQFFQMGASGLSGGVPEDIVSTITLEAAGRKNSVTAEEVFIQEGVPGDVNALFRLVKRFYTSIRFRSVPTP